MVKRNRKPIYIFILVLIALYLVIYVVPKLTGILETTEVLEAGVLSVDEPATCYIVRDETVYAAGAAGSLEYLVDEGTHVRNGTRVLKLTEDRSAAGSAAQTEEKAGTDSKGSKGSKGDKASKTGQAETGEETAKSPYAELMKRLSSSVILTSNGKAQDSGVIGYHIDGYENVLTPKNMDRLTYDDLAELSVKSQDLTRKTTAQKEPLFKICDNDTWYIICWVEAASIARYEKGNKVTVQLPAGNVPATISDITEDGQRWRLTFRSNRYYEEFTTVRAEEARIVSRDYSGLIASNGSITTRDGQPGVFVRQTSGEFAFVPVKVLDSNGEYSVLKEGTFVDEKGQSIDTVKVYDEILKRPGEGT